MRLGHSHNLIGASLMRLASNAEQATPIPPKLAEFAPRDVDRAANERFSDRDFAGDTPRSAGHSTANRLSGETRAKRESLRDFVQSTPGALVEEIRRRHRQVLVRRIGLIFLALVLGVSLSAAHFAWGVPLMPLAWGATAIGLIAVLGMAQTWSHTARQQARLHVRVSSTHRNLPLRPTNNTPGGGGVCPS